MLRTAGARKSRPSIGVVGRRLHMGFRAFGCAQASRIALRIAQLYAARLLVRFAAMAVASASWGGPQQSRCIREQRESARQENGSQRAKFGERTRPPDGVVKDLVHEGILRRAGKKTDSSESTKILLPGSWN